MKTRNPLVAYLPPREQLQQAVDAWGGVRRFARLAVLRDERTVYRWLSGDSPIPRPVRLHLVRFALGDHPAKDPYDHRYDFEELP